MKTELIKQMVTLADGFKLFYSENDASIVIKISPKSCSWRIDKIETWEHFPLLIRRAVDGWNQENKDTDYKYIDITENRVIYCSGRKIWNEYNGGKQIIFGSFKPTDTLTVEEVCLLMALEEVLKDERC